MPRSFHSSFERLPSTRGPWAPAGPEQLNPARRVDVSALFRSFWIAGFESASHINGAGLRIDMVSATQHDLQVEEDYARLAAWDIKTVRDGARWHLIHQGGGRYDFTSLLPFVEAARGHRIQVIWALCHYGWPDDLDILSPNFINSFARYCGAVARFIADQTEGIQFYTPINEMNFLAWAAGEKAYIHPYRDDAGGEIKHQLIRACIAGIEAIWAVDPTARIVHTEPITHVLTPKGRPELARAAARGNDGVGRAARPGNGAPPRSGSGQGRSATNGLQARSDRRCASLSLRQHLHCKFKLIR